MIILKDIIVAPQIITMRVENLLHFHLLFEMHYVANLILYFILLLSQMKHIKLTH